MSENKNRKSGNHMEDYNLQDTKLLEKSTSSASPDVCHDVDREEHAPGADLQYSIEDVPPWHICILLGFQKEWGNFQHYLTMFGSSISIPLIMAPALCMENDHVAKSEILGTLLFVSGIVTLLQTTFGSRLPVIQGGTFAFLSPMFAIMALPQWQCPPASDIANITSDNSGYGVTSLYGNGSNTNLLLGEDEPLWKPRIREIQGAIMVASVFEVLVGFSGVLGLLLHYIGPLSIAPTIALIGIALFKGAADFCAHHWWIAIMTMALVTLFSQYLRNINLPFPQYRRGKGISFVGYPVFKLFPVLLAIALSWLVCHIFTVTDVFPEDPQGWGHRARTDTKAQVIQDASWIRFPYPGQWGMPTVSTAGVFGMLAGVVAGTIESVGDYYAAARLSGAPPPPVHALNRGIFIEGLGCVLAGAWGSGNGTTTYSENVGAIGITKVGSRRVIQAGAAFMICLALLGKFAAVFVTIPDPIIGGLFMVMFGMIAAVGISNLQFVDLNSSRNLFIFGFSLFFGLSVPYWLSDHPDAIDTGSQFVDQVLTVLLSTSMFVGGALGFMLDNTIPGTDDERGIKEWRRHLVKNDENSEDNCITPIPTCYDLPVGMATLWRWKWTKYIPISPTFTGYSCHNRAHKVTKNSITITNAETQSSDF